ncbi:16S rRNA (guanine(966)-N(2))-methyltransferase RsmD [Enterovibrio norvegicus]|uniref:16S rRNA (guanine(966)-N(2))-methyltransferase RsmD n=1 Tax=Enterovibrio norvegicus TaxID=188144 RepID=UPI000C82AEB1|nr:16S rRNA (guanine(966)-N(2))-methyltransferase RsmD [Enterovibrio norvegicus]PMN72732.1 16S rRNA (guanine(966)-N(2))-methyltransferase RsmD [Enterovibrio norvegicus]
MVRRNPKNPATRNTSRGSNPSASTGGGSGFVRIISGKWRGRKLPVKNVEGLRPTTDRVKETVFNWLAADLYQAKCLDVFAGSGGLGLEALSRQAEHVTLLELDKGAADQIKLNINTLNADNATVVNTDALSYLSQSGQAFDVVFIDPPFRKELLSDVITRLEQNGWLSPNAMIYIEAEKELGAIDVPVHWDMVKEKHAGQVSFRLYQREEE